jgi:hypothetical protein
MTPVFRRSMVPSSSRDLLGCDAVCKDGGSMVLRNFGTVQQYWWKWRQRGTLKIWYPTTTLHGVTTQKTSTWKIIIRSYKVWKLKKRMYRWTIGVLGFDSRRGWEFFSSSPRPERLWGPPSFLYNGYQGLFPWGVKMTTHLNLVPRSRMRGDKPPLPQYAFIGRCSVKAQGQLYLCFYLYYTLSLCCISIKLVTRPNRIQPNCTYLSFHVRFPLSLFKEIWR